MDFLCVCSVVSKFAEVGGGDEGAFDVPEFDDCADWVEEFELDVAFVEVSVACAAGDRFVVEADPFHDLLCAGWGDGVVEGDAHGLELGEACHVAAGVDEWDFDFVCRESWAGGGLDDVGVDALDHKYPSILAFWLEFIGNH